MRLFRRYVGVSSCFVLVVLSGCVVAPAPYVAAPYPYYTESNVAPPPPVSEVVGIAPYPGYFWISGYWSWVGGRYAWHQGHWQAPRQGYRWVPHRWERQGDAWRAQQGHWERRH